jgi:hypothetical protein
VVERWGGVRIGGVMVTISRVSNRYKVLFSPGVPGWRGFSVAVRDLETVHIVIDHWYGAHGQNFGPCPLCTGKLGRNKPCRAPRGKG